MKKLISVLAIFLLASCANSPKDSELAIANDFAEFSNSLKGSWFVEIDKSDKENLKVLSISDEIGKNTDRVLWFPLNSYKANVIEKYTGDCVRGRGWKGRKCSSVSDEYIFIKTEMSEGQVAGNVLSGFLTLGISAVSGHTTTYKIDEESFLLGVGRAMQYFSGGSKNYSLLNDIYDLEKNITNEYRLTSEKYIKFGDRLPHSAEFYVFNRKFNSYQEIADYREQLSSENYPARLKLAQAAARLPEMEQRYIERQENALALKNASIKAQADREKAERLKRQEFLNKQRASWNRFNQLGEAMWETRNILSHKRGDEICSYKGNKSGFVEDISGSKIKVLWKAHISNQPDGFYFGNMAYSNMSKDTVERTEYMVTSMEEITWVEVDTVASCSIGEIQ